VIRPIAPPDSHSASRLWQSGAVRRVVLLLVVAGLGLGACDRPGSVAVHRRLDRLTDAVDALGRAVAGVPAPVEPAKPDPAPPVSIDLQGAPVWGPQQAPHTVIVASDFACAHSARLWPTIEQLRRRQPDRVRVVALQLAAYPDRSRVAALAGCAAARQGRFFDYLPRVYVDGLRHEAEGGLGRTRLVALAHELGLDEARFARDLDDPTCAAEIADQDRRLRAAGIEGTPALFVDGRRVPAGTSLTDLEALVR
jgi:protein-disulfide isomerase